MEVQDRLGEASAFYTKELESLTVDIEFNPGTLQHFVIVQFAGWRLRLTLDYTDGLQRLCMDADPVVSKREIVDLLVSDLVTFLLKSEADRHAITK